MPPSLYGMGDDAAQFFMGDSPRPCWAPGERIPVPRPKKSCKVKGLYEKRKVWMGDWARTREGGLVAFDLRHNRFGRVVSARMSFQGQARYPGSKLHKWNTATRWARREMGVTHFIKMGKGEEGRTLLELTHEIYARILLHHDGDDLVVGRPIPSPAEA